MQPGFPGCSHCRDHPGLSCLAKPLSPWRDVTCQRSSHFVPCIQRAAWLGEAWEKLCKDQAKGNSCGFAGAGATRSCATPYSDRRERVELQRGRRHRRNSLISGPEGLSLVYLLALILSHQAVCSGQGLSLLHRWWGGDESAVGQAVSPFGDPQPPAASTFVRGVTVAGGGGSR